MTLKTNQIVTTKLNVFLEEHAYNKAEVARKAGIDPDALYMMLTNKKIMTADHFVNICNVLGKTPSEIISDTFSIHAS